MPEQLLSVEAAARVKHLELFARSRVESHFKGAHRSRLKGHSTDFLQDRPYLPGDDIRALDWRVYARSEVCFQGEVQQRVDVLVSPDAGDADQAFEDLQSWRQDFPAAQLVDQDGHQGKRLIGQDGGRKQPVAQFVIEGPRQFDVPEMQAEGREVLPASRVTTRVQPITVRVDAELVCEVLEHLTWELFARTDTATEMP